MLAVRNKRSHLELGPLDNDQVSIPSNYGQRRAHATRDRPHHVIIQDGYCDSHCLVFIRDRS